MTATLLIATTVSIGQAIDANQARQIATDRLSGEQRARREADQARRDAEAQRDRANRERERAERERQRAESERLRAESERQRVESEQRRVQRNLDSALESVDRLLAHVGAWDVSGVPFLPAPLLDHIRGDAVELYERLLADSDNSPAVRHALAKFQVAIAHSAGAKREAQLRAAVASLEDLAKSDPNNHKFQQSLAMAYFTIGNFYWNQSEKPDLDKAIEFKRRASRLFRELDAAGVQPTELGTRFGSFLDLRINALMQLSNILRSLGKSGEADDAMREAEKAADSLQDPLSAALSSILQLKANRIAKSAPDEADELYLAAIDISRRRIAEGIAPSGWHQNVFAQQLMRFAGHTRTRKPEAAEGALDEAIGVLRRIVAGLGNASYRFTFTEAALIKARLLLGQNIPNASRAQTLEQRRQIAAALLEEAITFAKQIRDEYPDNQKYVQRLAELSGFQAQHFGLIASLKADIVAATKTEKHEAAEVAARKMLAACEEQLGSDHSETFGAMQELAWTLFHQGKFVEAEPYFRRWVTWSEKVSPKSWETFNRKSVFGIYLVRAAGELQSTDSAAALEKLAEAENILLTSHQGIKAQYDKIPAEWKKRLPESIERLIQLYKAWNKPAEAARWQAELEALRELENRQRTTTAPPSGP